MSGRGWSGIGVRWVRRALLGSGPLKRRVDHVETGLRLLAVVAVISAVALGTVLGAYVAARASGVQQVQDRATTVVAAHVDTPPTWVPTGLLSRTPSARATWSDPAHPHQLRHELVPVPPTAHEGATVALRVSTVTGGPPSDTGASPAVLGLGAGLATGFLVLVPVGALSWATRSWLGRIRARAWDTEWARVGPEWRAHR
ncbi:hypothetical protein [Klenkia sp. PcliD-1-E]|uniref:hypothetical protein n=1 Tax=Klenkia sp. PcliD-1-E TaxID=2954492 RepID=UPI0020974C62|nr:hypothetical protein [Klenkia sp. PcliD-1-E]MCO7220053.1 hypothetical protein [Klenkia sp. PcliD-1-E]